MTSPPSKAVTHTPKDGRFIIDTGGENVPELVYDMRDENIVMNAVRVPVEFRKQGLASELTRTALEFAKENKLRVVPRCPFVQWYLREHPEYQPLTQPPDSR